MTTKPPPGAAGREPPASELAPNASVGELVTEIDRARHQVARTAAALTAKVNVPARIRRSTHERAQALAWDGRRVAADLKTTRQQLARAIPPWLVVLLRAAGRAPLPVVAGVVLLLMLRRRRRRA